jgi:hypothetical protein
MKSNVRQLMFVAVVLPAGLFPGASAAEEDKDLPPAALTEKWEPVPRVVDATGKVPSDAIVLFDGSSADAWEHEDGRKVEWPVEGGALVVKPKSKNIKTKASFGDIQLHLEFRSPSEVKGTSQKRGNSGLFFMMEYELQILDSYENATYVNGQAGSVYKQYPPLVNASRPPGVWQTYDVIWTAPRFNADGSVRSPARMTVFHNGVLVQNNVELRGRTENRGEPKYHPHAPRAPLMLQDHSDLVAFRNIWVREL